MEANILLWIQENLRMDIINEFFIFITHLGDAGWLWIAFSLIFLLIKKYRRVGITTSLALIYDLLFVNILAKNIFARQRPYEVIEGLSILIEAQSDKSFPSGHTAASFAFITVAILLLPKKFSIPTTVIAFLIAYSRLHVGVHYPTDILGGIVIGILCGTLSYYTVKFIENKRKKELS